MFAIGANGLHRASSVGETTVDERTTDVQAKRVSMFTSNAENTLRKTARVAQMRRGTLLGLGASLRDRRGRSSNPVMVSNMTRNISIRNPDEPRGSILGSASLVATLLSGQVPMGFASTESIEEEGMFYPVVFSVLILLLATLS